MTTAHTYPPQRMRGVAAVPIVLFMFLITGIMLFYVNRGLIFEQRTSANQYRATQAFEVADAGMEWALANLSWQQFIDGNCQATTGTTTFRERYISFDASGVITPALAGVRAGCSIASDGTLSCACPTTTTLTIPNVGTNPYFTVEFTSAGGTTPGIVNVTVLGCTPSSSSSPDARCVTGGSGTSDGVAEIHSLFGIATALGGMPSATITAKGAVAMKGAGAAVGVYNSDASVSGITIDSGEDVDPEKAKLVTVPGSDPNSSYIENDPALSSITADEMFQNYFNMTKADKKRASYVIDCKTVYTSKTACASALEEATNNGVQNIWIEGDIEVKGNTDIGNPTSNPKRPVNLIATGNATFGATTTFYGFLYVMGENGTSTPEWDFQGGGNGLIRGSGATEGNFSTSNGTPDFYYDSESLQILNQNVGVFVRIPGSWIDF